MRMDITKSMRDRMDRERYRIERTGALTVNSAIQIKVNGKMINAKTTTCTTEGRFVNASANGKTYFCEFDGGIWKAKGKA